MAEQTQALSEFQAEVVRLVDEHWGLRQPLEYKVLKEDYNNVYQVTLATGQQAIVKAQKITSPEKRQNAESKAAQIHTFVDFVAKQGVKIANFIGKAQASSDTCHVCVFHFAPGQHMSTTTTADSLKPEIAREIGSWLRGFHNAAIKFQHEMPDEYAKFSDYETKDWSDCGMWKFTPVPSLPKTPETFGITHCDMHRGNLKFEVDESGQHSVCVFDTDVLHRCWYLLDVGAIVFDYQMNIEFCLGAYDSAEKMADAQQKCRQACDWILEGYASPVDREELRLACNMRRDFLYQILGLFLVWGLVQESTETGTFIKNFRKHYDDGRIQSYATCGLEQS